MFTYHISPYSDSLSASLFAGIKASLDAGRKAYLVVPAQFTLESEKALMQYLDTDVLFRAQVKSFSALEREILSTGYGLKLPVIGDAGRRMLLTCLLEDHAEQLTVFSSTIRREGFIDQLSGMIQEFKEYRIPPDGIREIADRLTDTPKMQEKLFEIVKIYEWYCEAMDDVFLDQDDRFGMAFSQLTEGSFFADTDFFFDDFYSMSRMELEALRSLHEAGRSLSFSILLDIESAQKIYFADRKDIERILDETLPYGEVFSIPAHFFKNLCVLANGKDHMIDATISSKKPGEAFDALAKGFFSYDAKPVTLEQVPISISACRNTEEEADVVCARVRRLVIEEGVRYQDIQVVLTDVDEYGDYIKRKFTRDGIPFFMDEKRKVSYHPYLMMIRSVLRMILYGFHHEDVLALIKSGFGNFSPEDTKTYQNFILRRKISRGMFFDRKYFTPDHAFMSRYPHRREQWLKEYDTAQRINEAIFEQTAAFIRIASEEHTMRDFAGALYHFLDSDAAMKPFEALGERYQRDNMLEQLEEHMQLMEEVSAVLDQLVEIAGDRKGSFAFFYTLLSEGLDGLSVGIIPPYQDQILVSSIHRSRSRTRKYVFFVGFSDAYIPKKSSQTSILSREEMDLIEESGHFLPSMASFSEREEKIALFTQLTKVGEKAQISYSGLSSKNEAMEKSFYLQKLPDYLPQLKITTLGEIPLTLALYSPGLLERKIPSLLRDGSCAAKQKAEEILLAMQQSTALNEVSGKIRKALNYSNTRNHLPKEQALKLYSVTGSLSATQLETMGRCPYQYFIRYGLRPEDVREFDVSNRDLGNLIHNSIDRWTAFVAEDPHAFRLKHEEESMALMLSCFRSEIEGVFDAVKRDDPRNALFIELGEKTITESHERLFSQLTQSETTQIFHEVAFGEGRVLPSIPVVLDDETLFVEGRIDRLDLIEKGKTYAQVVDYKTGAKIFDLAKVLGGIDLQLLLYLISVKEKGLIPMGAFYQSLMPLSVRSENEDETKPFALLEGVLLDHLHAAEAMDATLDACRASDSMLYRFRGRARAFESKENVLSEYQMRRLMEETYKNVCIAAEKRQKGVIGVNPYRMNYQTPCSYCAFQYVCRFEKKNQFHAYRFIPEKSLKTWKEENDG